MSTESVIKTIALKYFDDVGLAAASTPLTIESYENWLAAGFHGTMDYLKRHVEKKRDPQSLLAGAKSWIVVAQNYDTQEPLSIDLQEKMFEEKKGWVSRYARGQDYHTQIKERHVHLIKELIQQFPQASFLGCVDTAAVLERDVAFRGGLGWIGKNTCLLNQKKGSFFFISEILTTLELLSDKPVADHCGTCNRCIEACPTTALIEPYKLDATKCISYWTIESKLPPPTPLSEKFGTQFFGCDICQDVCPWNQRARKNENIKPQKDSGLTDMEFFIQSSNEEIKNRISGTALERAKPDHLRRNANIVLNNASAKFFKPL